MEKKKQIEFVTTAEAAWLLGISNGRVRQLIKNKRLESVKSCGTHKIALASLANIIVERMEEQLRNRRFDIAFGVNRHSKCTYAR